MSEFFIGQVSMYGFDFPPKGWAMCNGQLLAINQNQALFSLLGTTYGGNGVQTFGLPDLRGRTPLHFGNGAGLTPRTQGERSGEENHTLLTQEVPPHTHALNASKDAGSSFIPNNNFIANANLPIAATGTPVAMIAGGIGNAGGSQAHTNIQPYLVINFCIALTGIFPSRN